MMRRFFQSLEAHGVRYLLISGQASVLYGAATFSEDVDLWIAPSSSNLRALIEALREVKATVYKLTPPLQLGYLKRGHGFHFLLPDEFTPAYLDIMGKPPRVSSFSAAWRRASRLTCDWGAIAVVAIPDLVELKKTRRLSDYEVISTLVKIHLTKGAATRSDLLWGLNNVFRIEDAQWVLETWPYSKSMVVRTGRPWLEQLLLSGGVDSDNYEMVQSLLASEIAHHQHLDILYWSPVIQELRELRKSGLLQKEGLGLQQ